MLFLYIIIYNLLDVKLFKVLDTAFENFDNSIRTYLSKSLGSIGENFQKTQIFSIIFEGIKGIMQNVMFYIEDAFVEQNISTARRKSSIYSLAKISGYEPFFGSTANGNILISVKQNNGLDSGSNKIFIQNGCRLQNKNTGVTYNINLNNDFYVIDLSKPLFKKELEIIEGTWYKNQFIASGFELESFDLGIAGGYDKNYFTVKVNGELYSESANLYEMYENSKTYILRCGFDGNISIIFGDGLHGKLLSNSDVVEVRYLIHNGTLGNIDINDTPDLTFIDTVKDGKGNDIDINDYLSVEQSNIISGGVNEDTISVVKNMIGCNSRSLIYANDSNYKLFFNRFSFIGYSNIWSEKNSMIINATLLSNAKNKIVNSSEYFNLTQEDLLITKNEENIIYNVLNNSNKTFAGVSLNLVNPTIRNFSIIAYVKLNNSYNKENAKENIYNLIADYFMNIDTSQRFIPKSDITKKILDNDENILGFDFNFISETAEKCYYDGYYLQPTLTYINGEYKYIDKKIIYEKDSIPCLDNYGNISLTSNLEVAILHGNFNYYASKDDSNGKLNSIILDPIQIIFY